MTPGVAELERIAAAANGAVAAPLARLAPELAPTVVPLAGGLLVVLGPGMYVNRALALGYGVEVTDEDLAAVEELSASAGVPPEVEVSPLADPSLLARAAARGFLPVAFRSSLVRALVPDEPAPATEGLIVEEVGDGSGLATWQETVAEAYGDRTSEQRRISDLYVAAVAQLEETHLYVARMAGEPVGVGALSRIGGVAILGGMATIPPARGRGVQATLIRHRLAAAAAAGCEVALSSAGPGSGSERNLLRSGFTLACSILTMRRPPAA